MAQKALSLVFLLVFAGCATATQTMKTSTGRVHTLREAYSNVHLIEYGRDLLLVDAGYEKSAATIDARIRKLGLNPARIKAVLLTHGHADHAGGAAYFRRRYGAKIIVGDGDRPLLRQGHNDKLCPTGSRGRSDLKKHQSAKYRPVTADILIDKETTLSQLLGLAGKIVPMPGHTRGSLVLVVGNSAYVGDLFRGAIVGSSAEKHFYMCDQAANIRDIARLLTAYPQVKTFFTGHFGPVGREAVERFVEESKQRMARID
jgi:hydroxyacylglutathione hydrolase